MTQYRYTFDLCFGGPTDATENGFDSCFDCITGTSNQTSSEPGWIGKIKLFC